ncbi:MAG: SgcJ/EcaC family oxidoreductase [Pseudomonadota bacterium]
MGSGNLNVRRAISEVDRVATSQDIMQKLAQEYAIAWSSGNAAEVAAFFSEDGEICVNRGDVFRGREAITKMAEGYFTDFPDFDLRCDLMRKAGSHAVFVWTFEGHHDETGNHVVSHGWQEMELTEDYKIKSSLGWYDPEDYERQIKGA